MIFNLMWSGFTRMWSHKRLIVIFYLFNLFTALIMIWPLRMVMNRLAGQTLLGASLQHGLPGDFFVEFIQYNGSGLGLILYVWLILALLFWLGQLYLSGGVLKLYAGKKRYTAKYFWGSAGRYFGRFLRLFFAGALLLATLLLVVELLFLLPRLIFGKDPLAPVAWYLGWSKMLFRLFAVLLWVTVYDYARIFTIRHKEWAIWRSLWHAIRFCLRHFDAVLFLTLALVVLSLFAFFIYFAVADKITDDRVVTIILLFAIQQLFVLFRSLIRLTGFASELELHRCLTVKQT